MEALLITGTIKPYCNIKYNNIETRRVEYERNIERYINDTDFDIIVFAENSGYQFRYDKLKKLAEKKGKVFEYLNLSEYAEKGNISIGDAAIMRDALEKSKYLSGVGKVWKVSGRVYIRNVNSIIIRTQKYDNVFLYAPIYKSIQTWFFKAKVEDLKKIFLTPLAFEIMKKSCIEYAWEECYKNNCNDIVLNKFPIYPDAEGINSSGNLYTVSRGRLLVKNILLKLGWYTVK